MFIMNDVIYDEGLKWEEYLEKIPTMRSTMKKRYEASRRYEKVDYGDGRKIKAILLSDKKCGDCAWAVPILFGILEKVEMRAFFREEYPELQELFLTNGKRYVPKLVIVDENYSIVGEWGPRPSKMQKYVEKSIGILEKEVWKKTLFAYYRTKGSAGDLIVEIKEMLDRINSGNSPGETR